LKEEEEKKRTEKRTKNEEKGQVSTECFLNNGPHHFPSGKEDSDQRLALFKALISEELIFLLIFYAFAE